MPRECTCPAELGLESVECPKHGAAALAFMRTARRGDAAAVEHANRERAEQAGARLAARFFELRSKPGHRNVEVHINEPSLAALLAIAYRLGQKGEVPK